MKLPLVLSRADDSRSDSMHAGEMQYVDCDFRQQNAQLDISLHDVVGQLHRSSAASYS